MFKPIQVTQDIHWVGAQNPELRVFDVVMRTERGTSYNSYLLMDEHITLFETVKDGFEEQMLERIRSIVDPSRIEYIVLEHTEPDHSGAVGMLLDIAPNAKVLCSRAASGIVREIIGRDFDVQVVKTGDTLCTGKHTLQFLEVPFLHWPDSIFTYIPEEKALVSGDVFGFHRSDETMFTDITDDIEPDLHYYYQCIFGPFPTYIREMLEKISDKPIEAILPSHGTIHRTAEAIQKVRNHYDEWSREELVPNQPHRAFIGYCSSYGYTRTAANMIAETLQAAGWAVDCFDLGNCDFDQARDAAATSDLLLIGSSTLNYDVLPPVWKLLTSLSFHEVKRKPAAAFGSYGWSGEAVKFMEERLKQLGAKIVQPGLRFKMCPIGDKKDAILAFAQAINQGQSAT